MQHILSIQLYRLLCDTSLDHTIWPILNGPYKMVNIVNILETI